MPTMRLISSERSKLQKGKNGMKPNDTGCSVPKSSPQFWGTRREIVWCGYRPRMSVICIPCKYSTAQYVQVVKNKKFSIVEWEDKGRDREKKKGWRCEAYKILIGVFRWRYGLRIRLTDTLSGWESEWMSELVSECASKCVSEWVSE